MMRAKLTIKLCFLHKYSPRRDFPLVLTDYNRILEAKVSREQLKMINLHVKPLEK
jgi:hypothetical protein